MRKERVAVVMTSRDKALLQRISDYYGEGMAVVIRSLIRKEGKRLGMEEADSAFVLSDWRQEGEE